MAAMHWDYLAILVLLGVIIPLGGKFRVDRILRKPDTSSRERLRMYVSTVSMQWLLVAITAWRSAAHRVTPGALGLGLGRPVAVWLITLALAGLVLTHQLLSLKMLERRPADLGGRVAAVALRVFPRNHRERVAFVAVLLTVSLCEEFLFRGFAFFWFATVFSSSFMAVVGSAALFSLAHLYQGTRGLLATLVVGMLFALARLGAGTLMPCVIGHFVIDFIAGYFFPAKIRNTLRTSRVVAASGVEEP